MIIKPTKTRETGFSACPHHKRSVFRACTKSRLSPRFTVFVFVLALLCRWTKTSKILVIIVVTSAGGLVSPILDSQNVETLDECQRAGGGWIETEGVVKGEKRFPSLSSTWVLKFLLEEGKFIISKVIKSPCEGKYRNNKSIKNLLQAGGNLSDWAKIFATSDLVKFWYRQLCYICQFNVFQSCYTNQRLISNFPLGGKAVKSGTSWLIGEYLSWVFTMWNRMCNPFSFSEFIYSGIVADTW